MSIAHIGPRAAEIEAMLTAVQAASLEELIDQTVPAKIRLQSPLELELPRTEAQILAELRALAARNKLYRSFIGMGYYDCIMPPVVMRNIFENPGWYTQYTPYQAEIAQGRLEALLNFQTMITDLTGMDIANASLLDEGTAAAEAMTLCHRQRPRNSKAETFFVSELCHPQTIAVVENRAAPLGIHVVVGDHKTYDFADTFGALLQYPATNGDIYDYAPFITAAHAHDVSGCRGDGFAGVDAAARPRRVRRRCGGWQQPAFRRAHGVWRSTCRFLRHTRRVQTQHARPLDRCVGGHTRQPGHAAVTPDTRTAHSPGKGDQQHLYGSGAVGNSGLDVCGLSWAGRDSAACPAGQIADR